MRYFHPIVGLLLAAVLTPDLSLAQGKRVALVIGNSEYKHTLRLENPKNGATDMAAMLKKLSFTVIEGRDLDKAAMDSNIRDFAVALGDAQTGLFFYAGHGLQVGGQNYLVPIDAKLTTASAIDFEMVRLDLVQRSMERETSTNIIIMDACRDNPLARNLARALGTRSTQIGRGFAPVESGEGTLISYSTQPGNVALDGKGRNSPFAAALLKNVPTPGDDLATILINVRNDVMRETDRRQVPWENSAMTAKFYFIPPRPTTEQIEFQFWLSVKDSANPAVLGTYLEKYPAGEYAPVARALIEHYDRQLKLELAARERDRRQQEEEMRAAEAKRLEDEQRVRETTLTAERKRAEDAKNTQQAARLEKERAELLARNEELRKALEKARLARDAAKAADEQRLAAAKAADTATKAAENAIAKKRDAEHTNDPAKVAALPKVGLPANKETSDHRWTITWTRGPGCGQGGGGTYSRHFRLSASGTATWMAPSAADGAPIRYQGKFGDNTGSGTFSRLDGKCSGTFTARRN